METLILTSSGKFIIENNIDQYLPKKLTDCKIAYIITASKTSRNIDFVDEQRAAMKDKELDYTEIDIEGKSEGDLRNEFEGYDIIFVEGGTPFFLLKCVKESGFENVLRELLKKGVVYIGSSSGSYIACPTVEVALWTKPNRARYGLSDISAMNLVPFILKAHYPDDLKEMLTEKARESDYPLKVLTDEQALLVRDGEVTFLGNTEEIVI